MMARRGKKVRINGDGLSCPAAARAFGFKPLPEVLESGNGLVGFGIVSDPEIGRKMFQSMTTLEKGSIQDIALFPLENAPMTPDIVVLEGEVEKLMWIVLAYLHVMGGERVDSTTSVLQATCVDSTIIPFMEDRLNMTFGCYGCREATDIDGTETILGFPGHFLEEITEHVEFLSRKAIPRSRGKNVFHSLVNKTEAAVSCQNA
jgi:uncharacterized protein (DUF169 family)